ncbi:MAG: COX15/CtaA family protein [Planctomycetota bacterium]|jgi:cytochrome c oxidase assembly protein subunit 15
MTEHSNTDLWRHRFCILTALATLPLIFVGGAVTSKGAGLSVPDWPLSYGQLMPPRWTEIEHVFYEHSHRILGATVGLLVLIQAVWMGLGERRAGLRYFSFALLAGVCVQGVLGGLRVTELSTTLAIVHGCAAQLFFSAMVVMALVSSPRWQRRTATRAAASEYSPRAALVCVAAVLVQLVLGAVTRHTGGTVIPHLAWAVVVMLVVQVNAARVLGCHRRIVALRGLAVLAGVLVTAQLAVGVATWSITATMHADVTASLVEWLVPTVHVVLGALLLAICVVLTVTAYRVLEDTPQCRVLIQNVPLPTP